MPQADTGSDQCAMLREGVCQLSHLGLSSTGLSEASILELLRVCGEIGHLPVAHLNISNNFTSQGNLTLRRKLQALSFTFWTQIISTLAPWEVKNSQQEDNSLQPLFQLLGSKLRHHHHDDAVWVLVACPAIQQQATVTLRSMHGA